MTPTAKRNSFTPLILLFLFSLLVFEIIAWDWWRHGPSSQWDVMILRHTDKLAASHPGVSGFSSLAGILGQSFFLWTLALLGAIYLARKKDWPALLFLLMAVALGSYLLEPVQAWFQRPRPWPDLPGVRGFSFPSGSAYFAAVVYGSLAFFASPHLSKRLARFALFLGALAAVLLVGVSRLALRLHWLTDVLGAYALALSWLLFIILLYKRFQQN